MGACFSWELISTTFIIWRLEMIQSAKDICFVSLKQFSMWHYYEEIFITIVFILKTSNAASTEWWKFGQNDNSPFQCKEFIIWFIF